MKTKIMSLILLATTLVSLNVLAGQQTRTNVYISQSTDYARGSLVGTRDTANSTEYIKCHLYNVGDTWQAMQCNAKDSDGIYASCWSENNLYIDTVKSITGDGSHIFFRWDNAGKCSQLDITTGSNYLR